MIDLGSRFAPSVWQIALVLALTAGAARIDAAAEKIVLAEGMENPESVVVGDDGRLYITVIGKSDTDGDGVVAVIEDGKPRPFATGLNDPKGIARKGKDLFVADKTKVWRIDSSGAASVLADADAFPTKPRFFNDIEVGPDGDIFVSDTGTFTANGAVFRIKPDKSITVVVDTKIAPYLKGPNGLLADGKEHLLLADFSAGRLYRVRIADGTLTELASGLGGADGIARDAKGRIYVSDWRGGRVSRIDSPGAKPTLFVDGFKAAADVALDGQGRLLVPDMRAGTLTAVPTSD